MGRKAKYSKEVKIKACEDYESGNFTFNEIAEMIGTVKEVVRTWYSRYKEHGSDVFNASNKERLYSKKFKLSVIEESISGNYTQSYLAIKYNITTGLIRNWVNKWYNGIEIKGYDTERDVYTMKPREVTFREKLDIVEWVIENDMNYKGAADKYSVSYARIYKWTNTYLNQGKEALKTKKRGPKTKIDDTNLSEIEKLKIELEKEKSLRKKREFEIEVLKKKEELEKEIYYQKSDKNRNTKQ